MYFYEVWVRSQRYHKTSPLTYSSPKRLAAGAVVQVPLQRELVSAVIVNAVPKPTFACKPIHAVFDLPALPSQLPGLMAWLHNYYPAGIGMTTQLFLPSTLTAKTAVPPPPNVTRNSNGPLPVQLNQEQTAAVATISEPGSYVLHGRTGSGKTRVYAALAKQTIDDARSVLVLSPEISLTPQLAEQLGRFLEHEIIVIHSKMTVKQRREAWLRILTATTPIIVVGPRSSLFTPIHNLGLIIMDESHEPAYKQEQQPHYYAPRVAAQLASLHQARLVFGSATPSVSEYYVAEQKHRPIIPLRSLATGAQDTTSRIIVDLKDRSQFAESSYLSTPLVTAVRQALHEGKQTMLYLNRRGTARLILCRACGWQATCPHCDLAMTYHGDTHQITCHTCGHHETPPTSCPTCQHPDILFTSAGTKAIADEAARLFPEAKIRRFDTDNLKADRLESHYQALVRGDIDILVGTQLLAKGLDLPKLTTLGVVLADSSLAIPDFTAQERTYQLLRQALGRVGRGHDNTATAIIQTYAPNNPTIQAALSNDWDSFYEHEISERKAFTFPPFCYVLKLTCSRASRTSSERATTDMRDQLRSVFGNSIIIDGPAPAFHERQGTKFAWQLIVKAKQRQRLLAVIDHLPASGWSYDIDPVNLL